MISLCQKPDTDQVLRGRQGSVYAKRQTRISLQSVLRGQTRYRLQSVPEGRRNKSMPRSRQGSFCAKRQTRIGLCQEADKYQSVPEGQTMNVP
jgi:hypothetical protein